MAGSASSGTHTTRSVSLLKQMVSYLIALHDMRLVMTSSERPGVLVVDGLFSIMIWKTSIFLEACSSQILYIALEAVFASCIYIA